MNIPYSNSGGVRVCACRIWHRQARERFPKNSNASNDGNRDAD